MSNSKMARSSKPTSYYPTTPIRNALTSKLIDEADLDDDFIEEVRNLKTQAASAKFLCAL